MQNFQIMKSCFFKLSLAAIAAMAFTGSASAVTFTLNQFNVAGYTGPFGTVTVTLVDNKHATLDYASATPQYFFGDGGSVAFNTNSTVGVVIGTPTFPENSPALFSAGAGNEDGWGSFSYRASSNGGWAERFSAVTLTLTNTLGTWATENDILTANAEGHFVAAHIFVANADGTAAAVTGFATDRSSEGPTVPDGGSTVALLGGALMLIGGIARRVIGIDVA